MYIRAKDTTLSIDDNDLKCMAFENTLYLILVYNCKKYDPINIWQWYEAHGLQKYLIPNICIKEQKIPPFRYMTMNWSAWPSKIPYTSYLYIIAKNMTLSIYDNDMMCMAFENT